MIRHGRHWPQGFQSTHPRGVRHEDKAAAVRRIVVSIHAPAWGATAVADAAPKEGDMFQSTHPRGVRRC